MSYFSLLHQYNTDEKNEIHQLELRGIVLIYHEILITDIKTKYGNKRRIDSFILELIMNGWATE